MLSYRGFNYSLYPSMQKINVKPGAKIEDYKAYGSLYSSVLDFLEQAKEPIASLKGRTIWMINSTALGGGVAEMLPSQMRILRELGVSIEWLVIEAREKAFFDITKRIHNAIHGSGNSIFTEEDRQVYEAVNRNNLPKALELINDGDIVVVHDPQPIFDSPVESPKSTVHVHVPEYMGVSMSPYVFAV